jgi:hypothetical protein
VYSPAATYSAYPVNGGTSNPTPSVTLPHYSFAYYKFIPAPGMNSLTLSISKTSDIQTAFYKNGREITANANGTSYTVSGLGTSDEIVLLIANTTGNDGANANFSTDGVLAAVTEPPVSTSTSGSSNSCFIATAAYGSYLHPQVRLLRDFRDRHLLSNAPGRAFVALYYRCSPPLADFIARHPLLRSVTRLLLTPLVTAVVHPLLSTAALLLFSGTVLVVSVRRIRIARSISHPI